MAQTPLLTAEDLLEMEDDGYLYELVRGELVRMTPPGGRHGEVAGETYWRIRNYLAEHGIGRVYPQDTGFLLAQDPDLVRAPDVAFVRADRLRPPDQRETYLPLAPDLVVEVLSPSDRAGLVNDKLTDYLEAGVRLVWIVEPRRRTVTVYHPDWTVRVLREGDALDGGEVLPGFRPPVAAIFR